ncbi:MAG: hypothetical protein HYR74_10585 [Candidatus Eisenbacteria bacterium]|nr:hypothetical protein [Candidatus Eisenbacteria bacterium]
MSLLQGDVVQLQHYRPHDMKGLNVFEPPKVDNVPFDGKKLFIGFGFAQQFQGLQHQNAAAPNVTTINGAPVNLNQLITIGKGFNNADANLNLDAQLARGIRVALTSYMSSRHHQEMWVKDGYLMVDESPIDNDVLKRVMDVVSLKVGHFEINYGDMHFRRSDNGNAFFNPFVGNLVMDAFTTEIGAEAYARSHGFFAMAGLTGGEIHGQVTAPTRRSPSYLSKLGYDRQIDRDMRVRLTGSLYINRRAVNNTLYSGSRAGSRYFDVLENTQSTESAQAWSGDVQPGFTNRVAAWVINPFFKYRGFELFGNIEQAKGRALPEVVDRTFNQYAGEGLYRFASDKLYLGGRYDVIKGTLKGMTSDVRVERYQAGGGWFVTTSVLAKVEYVRQNYKDYPTSDIHYNGRFHGFMVEGAVAF